jgi:hypothetical protein
MLCDQALGSSKSNGLGFQKVDEPEKERLHWARLETVKPLAGLEFARKSVFCHTPSGWISNKS